MPILIGHAHISPAIGKIGSFFAGKCHLHAGFARHGFQGDVRKYFRLNVRGDGLRKIAQCLFGHVQANHHSVASYAEPQLAGGMLVENGGYRNQPVFDLRQTPFQFDGFTFFHGRSCLRYPKPLMR